MKTILLVFCLCFSLGVSVVCAQTRSEDSANARRTAPVQQNMLLPERQTPRDAIGLRPSAEQCTYPGQLVTLPVTLDAVQANNQWFIQVDTVFIQLHPVSQQNQQPVFLLPSDNRIKPQQVYSVFVQAESAAYPRPISVTVRTCAFALNTVSAEHPDHNAGEIILLMETDFLLAVKKEVEDQGYSIVDQHSLQQLQQSLLIIRTDVRQLETAIQQLRREFPFAEVDRNHHYQISAEPRLYAKEKINWQLFNSYEFTSTTPLKVGMIDGDIALDHLSLVGQNIHQQSFYRGRASADKNHATAIAVLLAGNQQVPAFKGLLTDVELVAASVLEQFDYSAVATTESMVRALDWLMTHQVRLINISLSGSRQNAVLDKFLDLITGQGALIFAAAGNDKLQHTAAFPAAHPKVFAITAIDAANRIYPFANQGNYLDFSAPGVDIWTASSEGSGQYRSGTSFAVPYAVAVAANYLSINPNMSRHVLYETMRSYSEDLGPPEHDTVFGWGLIKLPEN
ncbi:S8 family serine peptidase [Nitrincola sp. A-D6]|uniref:S8 family serine peptidase n=1 Tax=Nitrincola sp. A-D6 TaxID=1545442 RepID=UPI00068BAFA3|nr:S8 family serine peptidase [Nitrincola sp. A-D6]